MESSGMMDGILVAIAIAILLGGLVMLFSGVRDFGDKG